METAGAKIPTGGPGDDPAKGGSGGKKEQGKPGHAQGPEVTVNSQKLETIIRAEKLALLDGYQGYALNAVQGLHYEFDPARLTLNISAPRGSLRNQGFRPRARQPATARRIAAGFLP